MNVKIQPIIRFLCIVIVLFAAFGAVLQHTDTAYADDYPIEYYTDYATYLENYYKGYNNNSSNSSNSYSSYSSSSYNDDDDDDGYDDRDNDDDDYYDSDNDDDGYYDNDNDDDDYYGRGQGSSSPSSSREYYGTISSRPSGASGTWIIGGAYFTVNSATRFEYGSHSRFYRGSYVEVEYSIINGRNVASKIELER